MRPGEREAFAARTIDPIARSVLGRATFRARRRDRVSPERHHHAPCRAKKEGARGGTTGSPARAQCGRRAKAANAGFRFPAAVKKPDCQPIPRLVSSRRMNHTIRSIRGFARAMAYDCRTYAACRATETPKRRSGGLVCQPYSVIQIGFFPQSLFTSAIKVLMLPSSMAVPPGLLFGVSLGFP